MSRIRYRGSVTLQLGVWGSAASSPIGVWGGAPEAISLFMLYKNRYKKAVHYMAIACHHITYCVLAENGEELDMKGMGGGGGGGGGRGTP